MLVAFNDGGIGTCGCKPVGRFLEGFGFMSCPQARGPISCGGPNYAKQDGKGMSFAAEFYVSFDV